MERAQFIILFRQFLFRFVELDAIAPQGDISKLLGQIAALLAGFSFWMGFPALAFGSQSGSHQALLLNAWTMEHFLISLTMLVVGVFAALSWDSAFPDRRDVFVLAPLPIRMRTVFFAKVVAVGAWLLIAVLALNAFTGILWPIAFELHGVGSLTPAGRGLTGIARSLFSHWTTLFLAATFVYGFILGIQGLASRVLPRRYFLRISAILQVALFASLFAGFFMQPPVASAFAGRQAWIPTFWFTALFQQLNGPDLTTLQPLAYRAWLAIAVSSIALAGTMLLSYVRTVRRIAEEPDLVPSSRRRSWNPALGSPLESALVRFILRTVARSRQHRTRLAFFYGIGFAVSALLLKAPRFQAPSSNDHLSLYPLVCTIMLLFLGVAGTQSVFSIPFALPSNWSFRLMPLETSGRIQSAKRKALWILAAGPVLLISSFGVAMSFPAMVAASHFAVLAVLATILIELSVGRNQQIPFTCSYLPGKSNAQVVFYGFFVAVFLIVRGAEWERLELEKVMAGQLSFFTGIAVMTVLLVGALFLRWNANHPPPADPLTFEDTPQPTILTLDLTPDGTSPKLWRSSTDRAV